MLLLPIRGLLSGVFSPMQQPGPVQKPMTYWGGIIPVELEPWERDAYEAQADPAPEPEADRPVEGWAVPPISSSIWAIITTKQADNPFLDLYLRAKTVYEHARTLWNEFCLWSEERRRHDDWAEWTCQVGYEDPRPNPAWRIKYVLEVRDWQEVRTSFHYATELAKWYVISLLHPHPRYVNANSSTVEQDLDERRESTSRSLQKSTTSWDGVDEGPSGGKAFMVKPVLSLVIS
jgi:hypothetical protein